MPKFEREKATHAEDLPHRFDGHGLDGHCELCLTGEDDPRHLAWERAQLHDRERAAAGETRFTRETGS